MYLVEHDLFNHGSRTHERNSAHDSTSLFVLSKNSCNSIFLLATVVGK